MSEYHLMNWCRALNQIFSLFWSVKFSKTVQKMSITVSRRSQLSNSNFFFCLTNSPKPKETQFRIRKDNQKLQVHVFWPVLWPVQPELQPWWWLQLQPRDPQAGSSGCRKPEAERSLRCKRCWWTRTCCWYGSLQGTHRVNTYTDGCTGEVCSSVLTWCVLLWGVWCERRQQSFRFELFLWNMFCGVVSGSTVLPLCYNTSTSSQTLVSLPFSSCSYFCSEQKSQLKLRLYFQSNIWSSF